MKTAGHGLASVLYYRCYNASLLGDFQNMQMYYLLLEEEYQKAQDKTPFLQFFDPEKMQLLKSVKQQIELGKCFEEFENFTPLEHEMEMTDSEIEEEKLIVRKVAKNQNMLTPFLQKKVKLVSLELQCGYGKKDRCDMVSKSEDETLYPIEFKLNKATHAVVGQIAKYCLHFKLKLINQTYKRVQGVVIAHSFSQFALNELKKRGYICLLHGGDLNNLRLSSI